MRAILAFAALLALFAPLVASTSLVTSSSAMPAGSFDKIVVIGDLHGDLAQGLELLRATGMVEYKPDYYRQKIQDQVRDWLRTGTGKLDDRIDRNDMNANMIFNKRGHLMAGSRPDQYHWAGGKSLVVVVGDVMDVGPDSIDILHLFMRLDGEASSVGGKFVFTLGNHEMNNLEGDFSGVHPWDLERSGGREGRVDLLSMLNPVGRYLRSRPILFEYDHLLFLHGGIFPATVKAMKERMHPWNRKHAVENLNHAVWQVLQGKEAWKRGDGSLAELLQVCSQHRAHEVGGIGVALPHRKLFVRVPKDLAVHPVIDTAHHAGALEIAGQQTVALGIPEHVRIPEVTMRCDQTRQSRTTWGGESCE